MNIFAMAALQCQGWKFIKFLCNFLHCKIIRNQTFIINPGGLIEHSGQTYICFLIEPNVIFNVQNTRLALLLLAFTFTVIHFGSLRCLLSMWWICDFFLKEDHTYWQISWSKQSEMCISPLFYNIWVVTRKQIPINHLPVCPAM